jgi:Rod binding domain-containing protein
MSDLSLHPHPAPQAGVAAAPSSNTPSPKLVSAAHEFEAAMMKELMAPLAPGRDSLEGGEDEGGSSSALSSFAGEALGKAISEHGGLGIAKSILHQLTAKSNHSGNTSVPAVLNGTTTKSSFQ